MSGIILFDGTCAFCEGSVRFVATRDNGYFKFGASQTAEARVLLARFDAVGDTTGTMIMIEGDRLYRRSDAVLQIARHMKAPWKYLSVFRLVPRPIRDAVYRFVAANRHRIAGRSNACEIPPPEIRARLITP